jgi:hypothetical protein
MMAPSPLVASASSVIQHDDGAIISPLKVLHDCDEGRMYSTSLMNLKQNPDDGASTLTFKSAA